jgi:hypothetical protein
VQIFGSVLHGDDTDDSGMDFLADPTPRARLVNIAKIRLKVPVCPMPQSMHWQPELYPTSYVNTPSREALAVWAKQIFFCWLCGWLPLFIVDIPSKQAITISNLIFFN